MKTVLIIEDGAELAACWQAAFELHDLRVIHEPQYEAAIGVLKDSQVDLVITDIALPNKAGEVFDFAGLAILSFISLHLENPPQVIAVSGYRSDQTNLICLELLDSANFLQKPFDVETIVDLGVKLIDKRSLEERWAKMKSIEDTHATGSVFWLNQQGEFVYAREAALSNYQYSKEELMKMTVGQINQWVESDEKFSTIWTVVKQQGRKTFRTSHQRKDGSTFPVEIAAHFVELEGDELVCCFVSDITQRLKDEEELRLLGAAVRTAQDAFLIVENIGSAESPEYNTVFVNEVYTTMTGYTFEETIGKKPRSLEGDKTNQDALIAIADGLSLWHPVHTEILLYAKSGTAFWCDFQMSPISDEEGSYTHWLIVMRDVTSMKQSSEALETVGSSHRAMVELLGSTDGVWDWDIRTNEVAFFPGYLKILGYDIDSPTKQVEHFSEFVSAVHRDDKQRVLNAQQESLDAKTPFEEEYRLRCRDGSYIWVHGRGATVYDQDAKPVRMVGSIYDITQQKTTAAALVNEREMLRRSNSDLEQFAYVASHDLQEPLRAVGGFMQILDREYSNQLDETGVGYIRKSVEGATRMQQLINDLLHFSRVTREHSALKAINLKAAIDAACSTLEKRIAQSSAKIDIGPMPEILGEVTQLTQLFQNLIDNGIKYCESKAPHISINSEETADQWLISVNDNGIGIAPEYRKQIFEIFKRLHRREEYPGTGIGLAICHRVVQRHGGTITIEDAVDSDGNPATGCRFILAFPKLEE